MSVVETPWLYQELAGWWHLFSPPSHYVEEAQDLLPELLAASDAPPRTLLELGAGAGSLAYHLQGKPDLTLTDRSPQMLEVSRRVNPECAHLLADMRTLDLGRTFDLVLVHDAIVYTTDNGSLEQVFQAAPRCLQRTHPKGRIADRHTLPSSLRQTDVGGIPCP